MTLLLQSLDSSGVLARTALQSSRKVMHSQWQRVQKRNQGDPLTAVSVVWLGWRRAKGVLRIDSNWNVCMEASDLLLEEGHLVVGDMQEVE